jgi:AcrR family transcriptional regulator
MSPKVADPSLRTALVETAARLVAVDGPKGLTLRRLATEVGTSTMAVYTHFGSMGDLRREIRREGFARLARHLDRVKDTDDPVADLALLGLAYSASATADPNLYRAMFLDGPVDDTDMATGLGTFDRLVRGVRRAVEAGRLRGDPEAMAIQLWAAVHGIVTLQFAGMLTPEQALAALRDIGGNLILAFGDRPDLVSGSLDAVAARAAAALTPGEGRLVSY